MPLLNGVEHIAMLRGRFGSERVVPGTIASETERTAPGKFIQRSPVVRMNLAANGEPLLGGIVARLGEVGFVCQFIRNEQTLLWGKLCFLAPFALDGTHARRVENSTAGAAELKRSVRLSPVLLQELFSRWTAGRRPD